MRNQMPFELPKNIILFLASTVQIHSIIMNIIINTSQSHPSSLFPEISTCKTIRHLNQIHAKLIKTAQFHDPLASAELLKITASLSKSTNFNYAYKLFNSMNEPNCFSWNTIIKALAESHHPLNALLTFHQMLIKGSSVHVHVQVQPNRFTFPSVFKACARAKAIQQGKQIHGLVFKFGYHRDEFVLTNLLRMYVLSGEMDDAHVLFDTSVGSDCNVVLCNVMIDGYFRIGELDFARELFDQMPHKSVVSWNGMIAGYAQGGKYKEALDVFYDMQRTDICPNYVTLVSVLPAISRLGALELGKWLHLYSERIGIGIDDVLGSALVDMYSKCGAIEKALQVFQNLPKKNSITWNAIIAGLAMHGRANEALDHFLLMEQAKIPPTDVTYIAILTACSHAGLLNEGRLFFNHMVSISGLKPRIEHYGCMVDLLGRAGCLKEAEELINEMPIDPDDVIWKTLLGACKIHQNVEMGKRVAKHLMKIAPNDSGAYVGLSNIYASLGNWEEVADVRLKMKEMEIRKDPGCSSTEIDGVIHEFVVEDASHPRVKEIRSMLDEISTHLTLEGYIPDTGPVLLNMEKEEKESVVYYHSERIAVAFGLISSSPQTPLRIVKNLRMCNDCHTWFKLISKVYKRKIAVRDRKRFHHFEDGSCCCKDYW